jgi:hypothetical protein
LSTESCKKNNVLKREEHVPIRKYVKMIEGNLKAVALNAVKGESILP